MNFFWFEPSHLPVIIVVMLVAFSVHEFAHAWTAWRFGDDTAYLQGRVTLNPMAHLDWLGMILLLIAGFGWAKPVPVRRSRFKNPRLMSIVVSAAGPISNLLLAFFFMFFIDLLYLFHVFDQAGSSFLGQVDIFIMYWVKINLVLFLFNLIPLPPLDGYRIVEEFLPVKIQIQVQQWAQWTTFLFLLLVFLPPLRNITIGPLLGLSTPILNGMIGLLDLLFSFGGGSVFS